MLRFDYNPYIAALPLEVLTDRPRALTGRTPAILTEQVEGANDQVACKPGGCDWGSLVLKETLHALCMSQDGKDATQQDACRAVFQSL